ncbi:Predicted oxidoreductase, contains short-chain dehydrogenase (SDR) and DUF2520 domains [Kytococcus aerolatus]|uniref:Predicted oxidoreductase, contains short-chain dehydrogenase (SDR) and DUF2520 domains n=1 Tax=Kytococcus aerolatus TaxID=592308 RepID=A0A212U682_9MICO|nr:DUF2520 domain-containing protein [Kytococcus aerolatus]SNC73729.1 Predicted oxidoreductase, contains short-chain dehydrogenase (SDR) and DUF2520 domains [Kytococcus aerolatus]
MHSEETAGAPRLRIGIIGAGRVGAVLGAAWEAAGHRVVAHSVGDAGAERAHGLLPHSIRRAPEEVPGEAELVLLAVPARDAAGLVNGLVTAGALRPGQLLVHTVPGVGVELFAPALAAGLPVLGVSLQPAMVFSGQAEDVQRLRDAVVCHLCPVEVDPVAQSLVAELGATPLRLEAVDLPRHDAAVTVATEGVAALVTTVRRALSRAGLAEPDAVAGPLLRASLEAALGSGEAPAGTSPSGPVSTWDAARLARHREALRAAPGDGAEDRAALAEVHLALERAAARHALAARIETPPVAREVLGELGLGSGSSPREGR